MHDAVWSAFEKFDVEMCVWKNQQLPMPQREETRTVVRRALDEWNQEIKNRFVRSAVLREPSTGQDLTIANGTGCSASTELLVPTNPRITSFIRDNPVPTITFTTISGHNYAVERKDALTAVGWTTVTNAGSIPGTVNLVTITDPDAGAGNLPRRFYHVVLLP